MAAPQVNNSFGSNCVMVSRRLEWTRCHPDNSAKCWALLGLNIVYASTEDARGNGWFLPRFTCADPVSGVSLECVFLAWCPERPGVALYTSEEWHYEPLMSYPGDKVYVREVPEALVLTCATTNLETCGCEATFTTVAGSMLLHIPLHTNLWLSLEDPVFLTVLATAAQNHLQSRNQEICLLLAGQVGPFANLSIPANFWDDLE